MRILHRKLCSCHKKLLANLAPAPRPEFSRYQQSHYGTFPITAAGFRRSMQHLLGVYSLEFEILEFFLVVDSSAARPGRAALE